MNRHPLPRLALLDLDGTLVDTAPDIAYCVDRVVESLGRPAVGLQRVRDWIGNGIEPLLERALTSRCEGRLEAAVLEAACRQFDALYAQHLCVRSRTYPGVMQGLEYLRESGVSLACVTNKPERHARALLAEQKLLDAFSLVLCGDSLPQSKPDPLPLLHALEVLGVEPERAVLIGDSVNDVLAARAAGISVICVSYGYNHGHRIHEAAPDRVIDSLADLPSVFIPAEASDARASRQNRSIST